MKITTIALLAVGVYFAWRAFKPNAAIVPAKPAARIPTDALLIPIPWRSVKSITTPLPGGGGYSTGGTRAPDGTNRTGAAPAPLGTAGGA